MEVVHALMFHLKVPKTFWIDVMSITFFLINQIPPSIYNNHVPHFTLFLSQPLFTLPPCFFFFCCIHFVQDVRPRISKFDHCALKCIFLGYPDHKKGYKCFALN